MKPPKVEHPSLEKNGFKVGENIRTKEGHTGVYLAKDQDGLEFEIRHRAGRWKAEPVVRMIGGVRDSRTFKANSLDLVAKKVLESSRRPKR